MATTGGTKTYELALSLVWLIAVFFGSGCEMAPAAIGATGGWNVGLSSKYHLVSTILSSEVSRSETSGEVGFQMTSELDVTAVWQDPKDRDVILLKIELKSPQLWIKSRRAPEPEGFIEHSSRLDDLSSKPIFALWKKGEVTRIFLNKNEKISSGNLKRGLVSIFQYRTLDDNYREHDASGWCNVTYVSHGPTRLEKLNDRCDHANVKAKDRHPNPIMGVDLVSSRRAVYQLDSHLLPIHMVEHEKHDLMLAAKTEIGTTVTSRRILKQISSTSGASIAKGQTVEQAIAHLEQGYEPAPIDLQTESTTCPDSGCQTLEEIIAENRNALETSALGTIKSALAFLKLLPAVQGATTDQLTALLKSPKYYSIRKQLFDVLGSASTSAGHQAAMNMLRKDETGDETERYLWALSMSPRPNADIIKDIIKRSEETMQNEKVSETLALTAAAMARQFADQSVVEKVHSSLELGLESCSGDDCRLKFLRGLRNLGAKASIPVLLDYAINGTRSSCLVAWQALSVISKESFDERIRNAALRTFYQYGERRDSSSRTLAVDIVLENQPSVSDLHGILEYLNSRDPVFEVRRYVSQRVQQLAEMDSNFRKILLKAENLQDKVKKNYDTLAHRGLSTAFTRPFLTSASSNGSLVTVQEVNSGLLKRGIVDVVVAIPAHEQALFSLGLFTSGLGSFIASSEEDQGDFEEEQVATAGMEISLLGVGVRPFVFFYGRGELMAHVWSGTASEKTPAYQAIVNLHRHSQYVPLASGFIAELEVEGAMSFDLAGQIQLSLWSRNAQSLVELATGIAIRGESRVRTEFVQNTAEFVLTVEPKLELSTDVDFAGPALVCMRLGQPETAIRHNVYKIERIPGSRHKLRKAKRSVLFSPAKSYLLNRKNNEMCSKIFS